MVRRSDALWVVVFGACLALVACGNSESDSSAPGPGEACDAEAESSCPEDYACTEDGEGETRCQKPAGTRCDLEADETYCVAGSECTEVSVDTADGGTRGECRVTRGNECDAEAPACAPDLRCAELESGGRACFAPVQVEGDVTDASTQEAIEGARVVGINDRRVAVTDVAVSGPEGNFTLELPTARQEDGTPIDKTFTLRASAADYQTFPGGLRQALPLNTSDATKQEGAWVLDQPPTDITLIGLPEDAQGSPSISGQVMGGDDAAGVLVVAENATGEGFSAVADKSGNYKIFNVPSGEYTVRGYAAGLQLEQASVTVESEAVTGVDLGTSEESLATVSGSVSIVDASGDAATSVFLVVESTFEEEFGRGDTPPGLRAPRTGAPDVTGGWTIEDVPDGDYVVLAAFENDGLVRDPDQSIGGTGIVRVSVPQNGSREISVSETFKVTEALEIIEPGADRPSQVSSAPTLTWADDSSEDYYGVKVYNAYGEMVWEQSRVPGVMGSNEVTVDYQGPTESGMYYQFRATSWREQGGGGSVSQTPISTTQDLKGVFYFE